MASTSASDDMEGNELLLLLDEYCCMRSEQRSDWGKIITCSSRSMGAPKQQGGQKSDWKRIFTCSSRSMGLPKQQGGRKSDWGRIEFDSACHMGIETDKVVFQSAGGTDKSSDTTRTEVAGRLVEIADSAPIPDMHVEDQDEIVQRLVTLLKSSGDNINDKIKQTPFLQQQLSSMSYDTFAKLTSSVQSLVRPEGRAAATTAAASDRRIQQQKIALAFEVTSTLSAMEIIPRRRVLSFADQYIQQHHQAWLQQHGGWTEAFENVD
ncbi:apoptosis facilitator Bcl-2-like protein 14 [Scomber scombrus]|uniref:apoptosis facilitator Bcl-2-like protein 14 n=1 Tax=Scomber scombrus TaxID=13677 RepID=UPI002DD7A67F|nr:apoptosis facilitator Bcl-2-like protein 14 [Scomber scombrus]